MSNLRELMDEATTYLSGLNEAKTSAEKAFFDGLPKDMLGSKRIKEIIKTERKLRWKGKPGPSKALDAAEDIIRSMPKGFTDGITQHFNAKDPKAWLAAELSKGWKPKAGKSTAKLMTKKAVGEIRAKMVSSVAPGTNMGLRAAKVIATQLITDNPGLVDSIKKFYIKLKTPADVKTALAKEIASI